MVCVVEWIIDAVNDLLVFYLFPASFTDLINFKYEQLAPHHLCR